jgi:hypothetical protein
VEFLVLYSNIILLIMLSFFKKYKMHKPKKRGLYAFTKYKRGEFLLFMGLLDDNTLEFMQLPSCLQYFISAEDFNNGVITNLLEFVNEIPVDVFEVCEANKIKV